MAGTELLLLLLLLLCVSGFRAEGEEEERKCLQEGGNLTVTCPYNIRKYASSLKAWQRVRSRGTLETLVHTETRNGDLNRAQAGRYLLEDYPKDAILTVTVTGLQRQDVGLYQCVIHLSPQDPIVLHHRIRLEWCRDRPVPVLAIVLTCGAILNKGLVFSVLLVLLRKPWPGVGQPSKVSAAQGTPGEQQPPLPEPPARPPAPATARSLRSSREHTSLPEPPL